MKKIKYLILSICMCFFGINKVMAFSINANQSVYVNSNVAVQIEAKGLTGRFDILSSDEGVLAGSDSKWIEDSSITVYFTAKSVGTATITVNATNVTDNNYNEYTGSRSIKINVVNKPAPPSINVNPTYSKNNYLKSLWIDDYELSPQFNKDTLEYNIVLNPGTEKINVHAEKEDSQASIKGTGEVNVSEGINTINIIVSAENGNERIYKISARVDEKDPINVKISNEDYTVIKKKELIEKKDGYVETTVKINNFDIPALHNEVTNVNLVGLKDKDGNIKLFLYDSRNNEYREYKEFTFDIMNLYIHEDKDSIYKKTTIKINDVDVLAYELDIADYYLIYATNTKTGYEGYYMYDKKENSVQRYNTEILDKITKERDKLLSIVLVLSSVCFLMMLFLLIIINRDNKIKNGI